MAMIGTAKSLETAALEESEAAVLSCGTSHDSLTSAQMPRKGSNELAVLRKRADFLKAAKARKQPCPGFLLQMRRRGTEESPSTPTRIRIGFTASKKVGNAVARNRAKRRLRALASKILPDHGQTGCDYVLIARAGATATRDYALMEKDLVWALRKIHSTEEKRSRKGQT